MSSPLFLGPDKAGPVMDKLPGIDRHCETIKPNGECPYLKLGCLGCTFKSRLTQANTLFIPGYLHQQQLPDKRMVGIMLLTFDRGRIVMWRDRFTVEDSW